VYSGKTTVEGQRNCPKHVEIYSRNKFEKLVHLVGFIVRIYHDVRSPERQIQAASAFPYESYSTAAFIAYFVITIVPT